VVSMYSRSMIPKFKMSSIGREFLCCLVMGPALGRRVSVPRYELSQPSRRIYEASGIDHKVWYSLWIWHRTEVVHLVIAQYERAIFIVGVVQFNHGIRVGV
jgi:hypothetical protein